MVSYVGRNVHFYTGDEGDFTPLLEVEGFGIPDFEIEITGNGAFDPDEVDKFFASIQLAAALQLIRRTLMDSVSLEGIPFEDR